MVFNFLTKNWKSVFAITKKKKKNMVNFDTKNGFSDSFPFQKCKLLSTSQYSLMVALLNKLQNWGLTVLMSRVEMAHSKINWVPWNIPYTNSMHELAKFACQEESVTQNEELTSHLGSGMVAKRLLYQSRPVSLIADRRKYRAQRMMRRLRVNKHQSNTSYLPLAVPSSLARGIFGD